ncbi:hypothetical protein LCGC14_0619250 [marine sediment metagenome]|uniref:Zinc-ribbon domain-containing protein n=1 Tax=marine sediment metagenome TaxID=412755 RepID=A0A0F9UDN5_9ZZZZ
MNGYEIDDNGDLTEAAKRNGWSDTWFCDNCGHEVTAHNSSPYCDDCGEQLY